MAVASLGVLVVLFVASQAHAQGDPRRRDDYYRGRVAVNHSADIALWIPRVLFFPVHVVAEYGIRRPVRAIVSFVVANHVPQIVERVLHPLPDFRWSPTFVADLGLITSVGVHGTIRHALVRPNVLSASAATGGLAFWHVAGEDRVTLGSVYFGARADYLTRPDFEFYGVGNRTQTSDLGYYRISRGLADAFIAYRPSSRLLVELVGGYEHDDTGNGAGPFGPPIAQQLARGTYATPPGFGAHALVVARANVVLDTRSRPEQQNTGLRLDAHGVFAQDIHDPQLRFATAEARIEAGVEVVHPGRVLVVSLWAMDTQPLGTEEIPFTHLATLGQTHLQGFRLGRYVGASAVVAELDYRYPIQAHVDAVWLLAAGNVFARHFADFDAARFAGTVGVGVRTRFARRASLEALVAVGTRRFDEPFGVDGLRIFLGVNEGL